MEDRNRKVPGDKVPRDLFSVVDAEVLCKWLCCFVQETRKESGERYPLLTLRQLLWTCGFEGEAEGKKEYATRDIRQLVQLYT